MKEYQRIQLITTEFDAEDVITTSGVPSDPDPNKRIVMNSPNHDSSGYPGSWNWTLWK